MKKFKGKGFYMINGTELIELGKDNEMVSPDSIEVEYFKNKGLLLQTYPDADIDGLRREYDDRMAMREKRKANGKRVRAKLTFDEFKEVKAMRVVRREQRKALKARERNG